MFAHSPINIPFAQEEFKSPKDNNSFKITLEKDLSTPITNKKDK
jgi:hypothetical protein